MTICTVLPVICADVTNGVPKAPVYSPMSVSGPPFRIYETFTYSELLNDPSDEIFASTWMPVYPEMLTTADLQTPSPPSVCALIRCDFIAK
jgi:hypothetical protein